MHNILVVWNTYSECQEVKCITLELFNDLFWQVDSGFFLEIDVKIVGKSIRDRVSLIKWRRQRIVLGRNGKTEESNTKTEAQNLLQVPSTAPPLGGPPSLPSETEELQTEAVSLVCSAPTSATTATRERQLDVEISTQKMIKIFFPQ